MKLYDEMELVPGIAITKVLGGEIYWKTFVCELTDNKIPTVAMAGVFVPEKS